MPTTATLDRRAQRREQIVAAAWEVATEHGLGGVSLHEVARRIGIRQPSLYGHVSSKLDLYDAMFADAYERLLTRIEDEPRSGPPREQLLALTRTVIDFAVESPARQQLLFQWTIPGFEPSPASYALAQRLVARCRELLSALGAGSDAQVDVYTALVAGLVSQQTANDLGGDRWTRHLEPLLEVFLDHFQPTDPSQPTDPTRPEEPA